jgi:hypothetical protein
VAVATALLGLAGVAAAEEAAEAQCTVATLRGLYQFAATGFTIVSGAAQPKAIVASWQFDGRGAFGDTATASINGTIAHPPFGTGTYTVSSDCRGTLTDPAGFTFDLFLSPRGTEFFVIQTNPNTVFAFRVARVSDILDSARVTWLQPGSLAGFGGADSLVIAGFAGGAAQAGEGVTLHWRDVTAGSAFTTAGYAPVPDSKGAWYNAIPSANLTHQYVVYVTYGDATSTTCTYAGNGQLNSCP